MKEGTNTFLGNTATGCYSFIGQGKIPSGNDSTNIGHAATSVYKSIVTGDSSRAFNNLDYIGGRNSYADPVGEQIHITPLNSGFVVKVGSQSFAVESTEKLIEKLSIYLREPSDISIWLVQIPGYKERTYPSHTLEGTGERILKHPGSTCGTDGTNQE